MNWYSVRCLFQFTEGTYEERITIWQAADIDAAIERAEKEAVTYCEEAELVAFIGLSQAYAMSDEPSSGAEIFSLLRDDDSPPNEYLDRFFATGKERTS